MVPPDGCKGGTDQDEDGDVMKGLDRIRVRKKEAAYVLHRPGSFLHITRQCALPYFQLLGAAEKGGADLSSEPFHRHGRGAQPCQE